MRQKKNTRGQEDGSTHVFGRKPVLEELTNRSSTVDVVLIQKGRGEKDIGLILDKCREHGIRFRFASRQDLDRVAEGNHQGVAARVSWQKFLDLEEVIEETLNAPLPLLIALDQVQDPGNVGTLARTIYGLGAGGIIAPKHNAAYIGPGALRASAGTLTRMPLAKVSNLSRALEICIEHGMTVYCAAAKGMTALPELDALRADLDLPAVLVLGNEEKGVRPGVLKRCDMSLYIPFGRVLDSMNVAQAGGIISAQFARCHGIR